MFETGLLPGAGLLGAGAFLLAEDEYSLDAETCLLCVVFVLSDDETGFTGLVPGLLEAVVGLAGFEPGLLEEFAGLVGFVPGLPVAFVGLPDFVPGLPELLEFLPVGLLAPDICELDGLLPLDEFEVAGLFPEEGL